MKYANWLVWLLVLVMISCAKETVVVDESEGASPEGQKQDIAYNIKVATMLDLINKARTSGCFCGSTAMPAVAALTWNDLLAKAAFDHSDDMKKSDYFSHTGTGNTSPGDRIKAAGYSWRTYGENIALGQNSEEQVMDAWLKSEGHCKNLMNKNFKEIGAGRSGNYWTQVFASK